MSFLKDGIRAVASEKVERETLTALGKIVPLYDERDNHNPKGRDVNPMFAAGWNAAIDAISARPNTECATCSMGIHQDCVPRATFDLAIQDAEKLGYEQGKKDGKSSVYRSHTSEDAR